MEIHPFRQPPPRRIQEGENLPNECPLFQDLGVEWPRDLNDTTVAEFLEVYEEQYYRQAVFEFDPESRYDQVGSAITNVENVSEADGGWRVHFSGIQGVRRASMSLNAKTTDPPEGAELLSPSLIDNQQVSELLDDGFETGEAKATIRGGEIHACVDRFEAISDDFEISEAGGRDTLYFDRVGTTVELMVSVDPGPHGDVYWDAWYYVTEHVVWRSGERDIDPREGALLE